MKQRHLKQTLALVIAVQMAISPAALAQEAGAGGSGTGTAGGGASNSSAPGSNQNSSKHWTETFANIMQGTTSLANQLIGSMQQRYSQIAAQNQANALQAQMNPANCGTGGQQVQCVSEVFPECNILNTRPNLVEPADCANGIDSTDPTAPNKAGVVMGYYNHYLQMENIYKKFNLETNATSNTGLGCLNARADQLARTLKKREEEIDNLINKMQKAQDNFKKQAEQDRAKIEDSMALLEGESYKGATRNGKGILDQNSVNFANSFNDPACKAVMSATDVTKDGRAKGLKGLENKMQEIANAKQSGDGSFNAIEFNGNTSSALQNKINEVARLVGREIQTRGPESLSGKFSGLPSAYGLNSASGPLQSIITEQAKQAELDQIDIEKELQPYKNTLSSNVIDAMNNDKADFNAALTSWERKSKNDCLINHPNIKNLVGKKIKLIDRSSSGFASRYSDNAFLTYIESVIIRTDISIEEKQRLIAAEQSKNGNDRFRVDTQKSASVGSTVKNTVDKMLPAEFIAMHAENCVEQFNNNEFANGKSGREIMEIARTVNQKKTTFRTQLAGKMQTAIVDRMVNCTDANTANATGAASCSSKDLSTASPNFCVKRANACATNMRQCYEKAQKLVKDVTGKRDAAVAQYKANMEKNQADLLKMYAQVEQITAVDGLNIAASLKQSLVLPTENLQFHVDSEDRQFVKGLETLEVQDPDQYFAMMKKNLLSLKKQVADQNQRVMNGDKSLGGESVAQQGVYGHIKNIQNNMSSIMGEIANFKQMCQGSFQAYMRGVQQSRQEALKAQQEGQKKQQEFCTNYMAFQASPGCESAEEFDSIIDAARSVGDRGALQEMTTWRRQCRQLGSDINVDEMTERSFNRIAGTTMQEFCSDNSRQRASNGACLRYSSYSGVCTGTNDARKAALKAYLIAKGKTDEEATTISNEAFAPTSSADVAQNINNQTGNLCASTTTQETLSIAVINAYGEEVIAANRSSAESTGERTQTGENRSAMCSAYDNSGNSVGKALSEAARTAGEAYINMGVYGQ